MAAFISTLRIDCILNGLFQPGSVCCIRVEGGFYLFDDVSYQSCLLFPFFLGNDRSPLVAESLFVPIPVYHCKFGNRLDVDSLFTDTETDVGLLLPVCRLFGCFQIYTYLHERLMLFVCVCKGITIPVNVPKYPEIN